MKAHTKENRKTGPVNVILSKIGWRQADLAHELGLNTCTINGFLSGRSTPSQKTADLIQRTLGRMGEYFDVFEQWPKLMGGEREDLTHEITDEHFCTDLANLEDSTRQHAYDRELKSVIEECLGTLLPREKTVLEYLIYEQLTSREAGARIGVGRQRIWQIAAVALRKLRHPMRIKMLGDYARDWASGPSGLRCIHTPPRRVEKKPQTERGRRQAQRKKNPTNWAGVDWTKSDICIAREVGLTRQAVWCARKKFVASDTSKTEPQ